MIPLTIALFMSGLGLNLNAPVQIAKIQETPKTPLTIPAVIIPNVPFYSQFADIQASEWKKVGCGVTSLTMIINYYSPDSVSVNTLLKQGIKEGAYLQNAGWTYKGLISLGKKYGLYGNSHDLSGLNEETSFSQFTSVILALAILAVVTAKSFICKVSTLSATPRGIVLFKTSTVSNTAPVKFALPNITSVDKTLPIGTDIKST